MLLPLLTTLSLSLSLFTTALAAPAPQSASTSDVVVNPELPLATTGPEPGNVHPPFFILPKKDVDLFCSCQIYLCTGLDFTGTCATFSAGIGIPGTCWSIPESFRGNVGSAGPDRGAICRVFE